MQALYCRERSIRRERETDLRATFTYTGTRVKNLEESLRFYTGLLGMRERGRNRFEAWGGEVVGLASEDGGSELELNYYPDGSAYATEYNAGEGLDHLAFKVDDLDKTLAEFEKAGYPTVLELASGSSRWAFVRDPNGIFIELFTQQAAPSSHNTSRSWGMQPSSKDYSQARCNEPAEGHEELRVVRRRRVEASAHLADGREEGSCSEKAEISSVWRTGG